MAKPLAVTRLAPLILIGVTRKSYDVPLVNPVTV